MSHMYVSTKTYGHEQGLSCAFRQHNAASHCRHIHGYALKVRLEFAASELDSNNWVVDFGSLKPVKAFLQDTFDHKLLVAVEDPMREIFEELAIVDLADVVIVQATGCEAFARLVADYVTQWLLENEGTRVTLAAVEVSEHAGNSALWVNCLSADEAHLVATYNEEGAKIG